MKKIILTFSTTLLLMLLSTSMFSQTTKGKSLVGLANAAANQCINDYRESEYDIKAVVETNGVCFVTTDLQEVNFYAVKKCRSTPCPRPIPVFVACVYFDCNREVLHVECAK